MGIQQDEDNYWKSFNKSPVPLILFDFKGKIFNLNKSVEKLFSIKVNKNDLIGKDLLEVLEINENKKLINNIKERFKRVINGEILEPIEVFLNKRDGSNLWVNINGSVVKINNNYYIQVIVHDITERKNIHEALYQSEARYRGLIENLNDGFGIIDENGKITYVNTKTCEILGYTSEELKKCHFTDIIAENFRDLTKKEFISRKKGKVNKYEIELKNKDGDRVPIILSPVPLFNLNGQFEGACAVITDISDQIKKEQDYRENYEKLEIMSQIIITGNQANDLHDLLNNILHLSLNILNFSAGSIYLMNEEGGTAKNIAHIGLTSDLLNKINKINVEDEHYKIVFLDGQPIFIDNIEESKFFGYKNTGFSSLTMVPITKKDTIIGALILLSKNIYMFSKFEKDLFQAIGQEMGTAIDRMLFEERLRESEERYRSLFESSPNAILIMNNSGIIIDCNSTSETLSGYKRSELLGKFFLDVAGVSKEDTPLFLDDFKNLLKEKIPERDFQLSNKGGDLIWVHYHASIVNLGEENLLQIIIQVIEDKKKAEEELKRSEEKYRFITENIGDTISVFDEKFQLIFVNENQERISGFTLDEIYSKNPFDYIHPGDKKKILDILKNIDKKKEASGIYRIKNKEGDYLWMDVRAKIFHDAEGELRYLLVSRDITEQKLAQEELKRSEEKYRFITENITDNITILDEKLRLRYTNELNDQIYGYSFNEVYDTDINKFIHPDDRLKIFKSIQDLSEKEEVSNTFRIRNKWGKHVWVDVRAKNIINPEGGRGYILVSRDITERILAEQKLKESEEKFRSLAEQSIAAIIILQDKKFKYVNQRLADINGYSVEEMRSWGLKDIIKTVHPDDVPLITQKLKEREMGLNNGINHYQFRSVKKTDEVIWLELYSKLILYEGRPADFITLMDITVQKESEFKYRVISENANDLICIINTRLELEYINEKAFRKTLGYSQEELIGDLNISLIHPEDLEKNLKPLREALKHGTGITQMRIRHKNGKFLWFEVKGTPFYDKNGKAKALLISRDISWHKEIEEKLREINRLKTDLLRRTSHELKTPLIAIKGNADLLLKFHKDKLDPKLIPIVRDIKYGCNRLENIIIDLLKSSQLESGKLKLKKTYDNFSFLIKFTVNELLEIAEKRDQIIQVDIHKNIMTLFEKEKIHEVLSNLLMNAIKNTPPDGIIYVKTQLNDSEVTISIEDSGIGITPEEKEKLFTQFGKIERYGQGLDLGIEGTGLGLYISKKMVELHGGRIWAESEGRNKGAIFYFTLPIIKK